MSRAVDHLAYGGAERWDTERFEVERDRDHFARGERDRFEERDRRASLSRGSDRGFGPGRERDRSIDGFYERERRGPRGFEDVYERRHYHDDEPRLERERPFARDRGQSITIEKERERYETPPPPRRGGNRPGFLRRQSSLDTFDRKTMIRFNDRDREDYRFADREEYGPPARFERRDRDEMRPPPLTPIPLPRTRALPPPRRFFEKECYEDIKVAEPDYCGDEEFRGYPERVREREILRRRRRSRSRESRVGESRSGRSVKGSVRSSSRGSSSSSSSPETVRSEFPKKGKTRMPARLVSKRAIIDLGYPYEEEGETIIIMKALGRENIDEVIKLSEDYMKVEKVEMSGGRSEAGNVVEERRTEVYTVPAPSPLPPPPPLPVAVPTQTTEFVKETKIIDIDREPSPAFSHQSHHRHHHGGAIILDARPREESTFVENRTREVVERSDPIPVGPLALAIPAERRRINDERAIRAEIKALEAEKEALKAQKKADREIRRADRYRGERHVSETDLVIYDRERYDTVGDEVTLVRREERFVEPEGGVRIQKDKKGRMSISVPKYI
ncbi:hypothetical protein BJ875DRAFT_501877 [Amylocarpus encephaloides]|uniref:DUF8035 domain-containing protein n=1 Tax=Amylocarpus encephaloides TaxID=45428 RepID=A0A9P7YSJ2_9HELO|nr:hypothetical protein BJ875DRAFT_501877 [Amylocarpus encephaloides]